MRTEQEMYDLILGFAKADERVRAVLLNGSRANPKAPRDQYQDYDIVYLVRDFASFTADHSWIDIFGQRLMLQMPEAMRDPSGAGHFNWMMLLADGNRIDMTLLPVERPELVGRDSLSVPLLDKDGILPHFPPANDGDYLVHKPSALFFSSCCNNFWWCLQNVAKGLVRDELPYAMMMYHNIVRVELHDMIDWYIGAECGFSVSAGKLGKYYKAYLPAPLYRQYLETYAAASPAAVWPAIYTMCDLFHTLATQVAAQLGLAYCEADERGMREYLEKVQGGQYNL